MPMLFIKCPATGVDIPTGMNVPKQMDLSGFRNNQIVCPVCKKPHTWDGKQGYFLEDQKNKDGKLN